MMCHNLNCLPQIQQAWSDGATPSIIPLNHLPNSDNKGCLANNGNGSVLIQAEPKTKLNWFILFWVCLESYQNQFYLIGMQKFSNLKLDYGENMHIKTSKFSELDFGENAYLKEPKLKLVFFFFLGKS